MSRPIVALGVTALLAACASPSPPAPPPIPTPAPISTPRTERTTLYGHGCLGAPLQSCIFMLQMLHGPNPEDLGEPRSEAPIIPGREQRPWRLRTIHLFNPGEDRRFGINSDRRAVTLTVDNATDVVTDVSIRFPIAYFGPGNRPSDYDRTNLWPLLDHLLPARCRFDSKEDAYRLIAGISEGIRRRESTHVDPGRYVSWAQSGLNSGNWCDYQVTVSSRSHTSYSTTGRSDGISGEIRIGPRPTPQQRRR